MGIIFIKYNHQSNLLIKMSSSNTTMLCIVLVCVAVLHVQAKGPCEDLVDGQAPSECVDCYDHCADSDICTNDDYNVNYRTNWCYKTCGLCESAPPLAKRRPRPGF